MNVIIIGAGIMGTTFATLAKELAPELDITILERLDGPGAGNSWVFNKEYFGGSEKKTFISWPAAPWRLNGQKPNPGVFLTSSVRPGFRGYNGFLRPPGTHEASL